MNSRTVAPQRTRSKKAESRFQRLWADAEALEKENLEFESELEALVKRIDTDVFHAERKLGEVIYDVVNHQLEFAKKKSLLKWQRSELKQWIDENLSDLIAMGLVDRALQDKLAILKAADIGFDIDNDSERSPYEQLNEYLQDDLNEAEQQADLFDTEADDIEDEDEIINDEELAELLRKLSERVEEHQQTIDEEASKTTRKGLSDAVFKRLFRQTATALHPDKESDVERRSEKHELMSQLLKARKEYDLITILRLHEKYAAAESALNIADQQELEDILQEYLNQQQQKFDDIVRKSPMHHMAYTEFYDRKPATVNRRINAHIKKIEEKKEGLLFFTKHVKTLRALTEILTDRYNANRYRDDW